MKLNPDCVRSVLFLVEEHSAVGTYIMIKNDDNDIPDGYSAREFLYHVKQCHDAGLVTNVKFFLDGGCTVSDLTPAGHEFLANTRSETVWNETKEVAKKVGGGSLDVLGKIAANVISEIIKRSMLP